jgi:hypothetical protein
MERKNTAHSVMGWRSYAEASMLTADTGGTARNAVAHIVGVTGTARSARSASGSRDGSSKATPSVNYLTKVVTAETSCIGL